MDINVTLTEMRRIAIRYPSANPESAENMAREMMEHFEALDEWLSSGGFLPYTWEADRTQIEGE